MKDTQWYVFYNCDIETGDFISIHEGYEDALVQYNNTYEEGDDNIVTFGIGKIVKSTDHEV